MVSCQMKTCAAVERDRGIDLLQSVERVETGVTVLTRHLTA